MDMTMGKMQKLYEKAKNSPSNFRFQDLIKLATFAGFVERPNPGRKKSGTSHLFFTHQDYEITINLQKGSSGKAKKYQVAQVLGYIDDYDLLKD